MFPHALPYLFPRGLSVGSCGSGPTSRDLPPTSKFLNSFLKPKGGSEKNKIISVLPINKQKLALQDSAQIKPLF